MQYIPHRGASHRYNEWVSLLNELTRNAEYLVDSGEYENLGYLALPVIYDDMKTGNNDLLTAMPDIADGLFVDDRAEVDNWTSEQWILRFEDNEDIISALQYTLDYEIYTPWFD